MWRRRDAASAAKARSIPGSNGAAEAVPFPGSGHFLNAFAKRLSDFRGEEHVCPTKALGKAMEMGHNQGWAEAG